MARTSRDSTIVVACVLPVLATSIARAGSHSPASGSLVDCVSQATTLIDCLDYIQQGRKATHNIVVDGEKGVENSLVCTTVVTRAAVASTTHNTGG